MTYQPQEIATIYFVNTSEDTDWPRSKVFVNSWNIGLMGANGYLKAEVPLKGTRAVTLRSELFGGTALPFTITPGEVYYIEFFVQTGPFRARPLLQPLSAEAGKALVAQMNPPKVSVSR